MIHCLTLLMVCDTAVQCSAPMQFIVVSNRAEQSKVYVLLYIPYCGDYPVFNFNIFYLE